MTQELLKPIQKRLGKGYFFGYGNPLLDQILEVDEELLNQYGLVKDGMILADDKHMPLYDYLKEQKNVKYMAGGASLNTLKMIQWLLQIPQTCTVAGRIENDVAGHCLMDECNRLKLNTRFQVTDGDGRTGQCAVLLHQNCRSMVTDLGVSRHYSYEALKSVHTWPSVERAQVYYMAGFAVTACFEGVMDIAKHSATENKLFCFNLSAVFLQHCFKDLIDPVLPYVDILFGNEDEALAYGKEHNLRTECLIEIGHYLACIPRADGSLRHRTVIITRAEEPVLVFRSHLGFAREFEVPKVKSEDIVDTNGAGDAFAGGFIAEYILKNDVEAAIRSATKAAKYIIQRSGFSLGPRQEWDHQQKTL